MIYSILSQKFDTYTGEVLSCHIFPVAYTDLERANQILKEHGDFLYAYRIVEHVTYKYDDTPRMHRFSLIWEEKGTEMEIVCGVIATYLD